MPAGGSIRKSGIIHDADGKPVLGPDGQPIMAGRARRKGKQQQTCEYIPVGRMISLHNMSATNIPAMVPHGKRASSIPDLYLVCELLDETNNRIDEHRTRHFKNVFSCHWEGEVMRVFTRPDPTCQGAHTSRQSPVPVQISLMHWNKKEHVLIAKWDVSLKRAKGKQSLDIPSSSASSSESSERAFISFEYEVTPQMVLKQEQEQGEDSDADDDAGFGYVGDETDQEG